jgi:iron complex transport system ATP-binding protein
MEDGEARQVLQASDLTFAYRGTTRPVLEHVSLSVARGDLVGILGPNGSGKTTLLKLLAGALQPSGGSVRLDGRALVQWARRDVARRVAYVPQETHSAFDFSVLDIVLMGRFPHLGAFALEGPEDLAIARAALEATGTDRFEQRIFGTLSGGEKQRVVIASALAQSADLLLLDEPTTSLDLGHQLDVRLLLHDLNQTKGITMVMSSHDLNFAAALCRQLVLLRDGHVLAAGAAEQVLTAENVRVLYGVEADIRLHQRTGCLTVTPVARAD